MIHFHLYARLDDTPVFSAPDDGLRPICSVRKGCWFGVTDRQGEWVRVITVKCQGWVKASEMESKSPLDLHAHVDHDAHLSFFNDGISA